MKIIQQKDLQTYNPEGSDLRKMQLRLLEMLSFLDTVCTKNGIKYWLGAGSLLGAVRHGGFIPWDDDIDIELMKKDYDVLIKILESELPVDLAIQTHKTDPFYVAPYAKLRDLKSRVFELNNKDYNYQFNGIYIDIFPIEKSNEHLIKFTGFLHSILLYRIMGTIKDKFGLLKILLKFNYKILSWFYAILRIITKIVRFETYHITFGSTLSKPIKASIFPLKRITFEGKEFNSPSDSDAYLKCIYGDYLVLPHPSKRITHISSVQFL
jgi:lipopolysaccharide cholinephosphotransferase